MTVQWIQTDATRFSQPRTYDGAVCLCEGAFGLLGRTDDPIDQPLSILCNISRSLKPQAKVMLTGLNAAAMIRTYANADVAAGRFDPSNLAESSECPPREGWPAVALLRWRSRSRVTAQQECAGDVGDATRLVHE